MAGSVDGDRQPEACPPQAVSVTSKTRSASPVGCSASGCQTWAAKTRAAALARSYPALGGFFFGRRDWHDSPGRSTTCIRCGPGCVVAIESERALPAALGNSSRRQTQTPTHRMPPGLAAHGLLMEGSNCL